MKAGAEASVAVIAWSLGGGCSPGGIIIGNQGQQFARHGCCEFAGQPVAGMKKIRYDWGLTQHCHQPNDCH